MLSTTIWKNPPLPPHLENPSNAQARVCGHQGFSNFFTCSANHQIYHFATPHLCWCNNTVVRIRQWFSVFDGPSHFGVGVRTRNFETPSWSRAFPYRLIHPTKHKMHLLRETWFSWFKISNVLKNFVQFKPLLFRIQRTQLLHYSWVFARLMILNRF